MSRGHRGSPEARRAGDPSTAWASIPRPSHDPQAHLVVRVFLAYILASCVCRLFEIPSGGVQILVIGATIALGIDRVLKNQEAIMVRLDDERGG